MEGVGTSLQERTEDQSVVLVIAFKNQKIRLEGWINREDTVHWSWIQEKLVLYCTVAYRTVLLRTDLQ